MRLFAFFIVFVACLLIPSHLIIKSVNLDRNCTGYLKRAADANTIDLALKELQKATTYLEDKNLTSGYTSILWETPDEDIEFWYKNLKESEKELTSLSSTSSQLEKTNVLMKLRETLLDSGEKSTQVTVPRGLSRFPNNSLYSLLLIISLLGVGFSFFLLLKN